MCQCAHARVSAAHANAGDREEANLIGKHPRSRRRGKPGEWNGSCMHTHALMRLQLLPFALSLSHSAM
eukprot:6183884-Pleurochrysis_carterae.AAC.4